MRWLRTLRLPVRGAQRLVFGWGLAGGLGLASLDLGGVGLAPERVVSASLCWSGNMLGIPARQLESGSRAEGADAASRSATGGGREAGHR
ncbi:hypothetical protein FRAHR75_340015 [Frankia sp. Hr75.2]|nr:hypothetical protein FRAHR75_340015 [Frankia sp. Hr75.2]